MVGGWVYGVWCMVYGVWWITTAVIIRPSQPSLAGVGAGAELGKNHEALNIACTKCDKMFANGRQVDEHMKDHVVGFNTPTADKICRYFRNGYCAKGEHCLYKHVQIQSEATPRCNRGQECVFMQQNRCNYFHPNIGVQRPKTNKIPKQCKFQEQCRNKFECNFTHNTQVFRPAMIWTRPPQGLKKMNVWQDY